MSSAQKVALGGDAVTVTSTAWQVAADVVVLGGKAGWKGVTVEQPLEPSAGHFGAVDVAMRYTELRVDDAAFPTVADPAKAARNAAAFAAGISWSPDRQLKVVLDYERTTFEGGAASGGDRPVESVVLGRLQTVF